MSRLPLMREVAFCEAKRRRERKRKTTPQSAAADSSPDKGSRQRLTTYLWVGGCPKMKYPRYAGGFLFIPQGWGCGSAHGGVSW